MVRVSHNIISYMLVQTLILVLSLVIFVLVPWSFSFIKSLWSHIIKEQQQQQQQQQQKN